MNNPTDRMLAIRERLAKATEWDANTYRDVYANAPADLEYLLTRVEAFEASSIILMSSGDICRLCGGASGYDSKLEHDRDMDGVGTMCPMHPNWEPKP